MDYPVLIAGRGPVGMTTALLLAHWGVATALVDPLPPTEATPGSKAVLISGHVAEITEPIGVGGSILDEGLAWTKSRTFIRGKEVLTTDTAVSNGLFPKVMNLTQERVEELLLEKIHAEPLVTLIPNSRVIDIKDDGSKVEVHIDTAGTQSTLTTAWLVGADGSRSTVRKTLQIPFNGYGHDENFLIVDIEAQLPFPNERHFHFDAAFNPGRTTLIHPQPNSTWHIDWQVGPEVDAEEEKASGQLEKRIRGVIGDVDYELHWLTTYRFKQLRAETFRKGRSFLVGDSAHLTSPYGARGMNSGIADAENLAWRLGMVLRYGAPEALLDGYAPEREHASKENIRITGKTARFMCPSTLWERIHRRVKLETARVFPPARRLIDSGNFYEPATYPPPLHENDSKVAVGTIAQDALIKSSDPNVTRLGALFRRGFVVLVFPGTIPDIKDNFISNMLEQFDPTIPLTILEVTPSATDQTHDPRHLRIADMNGSLRDNWVDETDAPQGTAYVIRPDAYVVERFSLADANEASSLKSIFPDKAERRTRDAKTGH